MRASMAEPLQPSQRRVERVLEHGLEQIQTPEQAREVVDRIEHQCAGETEDERGQAAAEQTAARPNPTDAAASVIEHASTDGVAGALEATAAQAVAPTPAAPKVAEAAQAAMAPGQPVSPPAQRGRELL